MSEYSIINVKKALYDHCTKEQADQVSKFLDSIMEELNSAPASSKVAFHEAYPGGLIDHIIRFINVGLSLNKDGIVDNGSLVRVAILHDIHKCRDAAKNPYYVPNILKSGKQSDAIPYSCNEKYANYLADVEPDDSLQIKELCYLSQFDKYTGGQRSLALIYAMDKALYDTLTPDETQAIIYHDGGYGTSKYELGGKESKLQIICHAADMLSSREGRV